MKLGAFSISLSVKDLAASKTFYEKLGFSAFGGDETQHWLIMKNEDAVVGLFQGMFEGNLLTFNPGWNGNARPVADYDDVREIQKTLRAAGIRVEPEVAEDSVGPASFMVSDPDGNVILIDQHI